MIFECVYLSSVSSFLLNDFTIPLSIVAPTISPQKAVVVPLEKPPKRFTKNKIMPIAYIKIAINDNTDFKPSFTLFHLLIIILSYDRDVVNFKAFLTLMNSTIIFALTNV